MHATPAGSMARISNSPPMAWMIFRSVLISMSERRSTLEIATERSLGATEGWGARLLALQSPAGNWGGPKWDLITLYSLVVLKDLGLDPAGNPARKMIGHVDRRLAFKWLGDPIFGNRH